MAEPFDKEYSQYYDLLYSDKDYQHEVAYIVDTFKKYQPGVKSILEYGSGTGNHSMILKEQGFSVTGVDSSEQMSRLARLKGLEVHVTNIADFGLDIKFDACISLFHVMSYVVNTTELDRVFRNTKQHLHPGSIFIFDVWYTPAVEHLQPQVRTKRMENAEAIIIRKSIPYSHNAQRMIDVNFQIDHTDKHTGARVEFSETHRLRHFTIEEIESVAGRTGFDLLKVEEPFTGRQPSVNTWGVNFILRSV